MLGIRPLVGSIIDSASAFASMRKILLTLRGAEVWFISAYLKMDALEVLTSGMHDSNRVAIMVRWASEDLVSGVSDLESFQYARGKGWKFFARTDLHAKTYRFGNEAIFMGSGNLTNMGFSLKYGGNLETMVRVEATESNIYSLKRIFDGSLEVSDELFNQIKEWIHLHPKEELLGEGKSQSAYPLERAMRERMKQLKPTCIAVSECFFTDGSWLESIHGKGVKDLSEEELHDLSLLAYNGPFDPMDINLDVLATNIVQTRIIEWIKSLIEEIPNKEIYFGQLSSDLHATLLDDPKPYRQDVKKLLANTLSWVALFPEIGLLVDKPNYSQRVFLI